MTLLSQALRCTLLWAIPVAILFTACGDSSIQIGSVTLIRHSTTITVNDANQGIVTVSCGTGESLVSGGFVQLENLPQVATALLGNFPSDSTGKPSTVPNAWTVQAVNVDGNENPTATAFVNCMRTPIMAQVTAITNEQVYTVTGLFTLKASCPTRTIRTGGGFRTSSPSPVISPQRSLDQINATFPTGAQDWTVNGFADSEGPKGSLISQKVDVTAVCVATSAFTAAPLISTIFTIPPQQVDTAVVCPTGSTIITQCESENRLNGNIACPAGQFTTGGGVSDFIIAPTTPGITFQNINSAYIYGDTAISDESSWLIQFHAYAYVVPGKPSGQGIATLWAVCLTPHS